MKRTVAIIDAEMESEEEAPMGAVRRRRLMITRRRLRRSGSAASRIDHEREEPRVRTLYYLYQAAQDSELR